MHRLDLASRLLDDAWCNDSLAEDGGVDGVVQMLLQGTKRAQPCDLKQDGLCHPLSRAPHFRVFTPKILA